MPVIPRLERLNRLLQLLEEKQSLSGRHSSHPVVREIEQDHCKTLSTALEEVHRKGTLMERLEMLEKRVLKLNLEMDEGNTSRSSSSNVPAPEKLPHGSKLQFTRQDDDEVVTLRGREDLLLIQEESSAEACVSKPTAHQNSGKQKRKAYRKWLSWIQLGC